VTGFELTGQLVSALAWPVLVGVVIIIARKQIRSIAEAIAQRVKFITKVTAPGVSVELEAEAKAVAQKTEEIEPPTQTVTLTGIESEEAFGNLRVTVAEASEERQTVRQRLAAEDPRAAILLSYIELERFLTHAYRAAYNVPNFRPWDLPQTAARLEEKDLLPPDSTVLVESLQAIRNKVLELKSQEVSHDTAKFFSEAVGNMMGYMLLSGAFDDKKAKEDDTEPGDR
jgi:hypothetical protein